MTEPKIGATILEPWHADSVGVRERMESTLQTIRRFAIVTVNDAPGGGYTVKVEVYKELEDMAKPDRQMGGRAVFNNPGSIFTPGMFARVQVPGSAPYEALLLPDGALGTEQIRKFVFVVNADNKKKARLNCIRHILDTLPYKDMRPVEIEIPPRQDDTGYKRPKMSSQRFVAEVY